VDTQVSGVEFQEVAALEFVDADFDRGPQCLRFERVSLEFRR